MCVVLLHVVWVGFKFGPIQQRQTKCLLTTRPKQQPVVVYHRWWKWNMLNLLCEVYYTDHKPTVTAAVKLEGSGEQEALSFIKETVTLKIQFTWKNWRKVVPENSVTRKAVWSGSTLSLLMHLLEPLLCAKTPVEKFQNHYRNYFVS